MVELVLNNKEIKMKYEMNCKVFGWITAKNPRNAQKIIRDILAKKHIYLVEPTFKCKKVPTSTK